MELGGIANNPSHVFLEDSVVRWLDVVGERYAGLSGKFNKSVVQYALTLLSKTGLKDLDIDITAAALNPRSGLRRSDSLCTDWA